MSRDDNRRIAEETQRILRSGYYTADGRNVTLDRGSISRACLITPEDENEDIEGPGDHKPSIRITEKDTVTAILARKNPGDTLVLNFASAMNPGGGFLSGASAQEEALCRASTLFSSLSSPAAAEMYRENREKDDPYYLEYAVYSPSVMIIRNPHGVLLGFPRMTSVLSVAAVNRNRKGVDDDIADGIMRKRIKRILRIAHGSGKRHLILGAWGCGVFGNKADDGAAWFHEAIDEDGGWFDSIEFAILPGRIDNITPFRNEFPR